MNTEDDSTVSNGLMERLAKLRAEVGDRSLSKREEPTQPTLLDRYKEDIPDIDLTQPAQLQQAEQTLDEFFRLLPIVAAYNRWGGSGAVPNSGKAEIKTRCPNPGHSDEHASFSMNQETGKFNCFSCGGGDVFILAAWYYGYPVPIPRDQFRTLRDQMAADFGIYVTKSITGEVILSKQPVPISPPEAEAEPTEPTATVSYTPEGSAFADQPEYDNRKHDRINWRNLVPEDTFLYEYLQATSTDDSPEEYHFWAGLLALGLAVGRNRTLQDHPEVYGNLFICFTGATGTGKSKAKGHLTSLLRQHLAYSTDDQPPLGAKIVKSAQSGEVLVARFIHPALDPTDPKKILGYFPIRLLTDYEELAGLVARSSRQGNTLKDVLMDMYDARGPLSSDSLANSFYAENTFGSALTTTQFKSVKDLISRGDDSSGFANRWVYAVGIEKEPFSRIKDTPNLTRAGGLLRLINSTSLSHTQITWTDTADAAWEKFFRDKVLPYKKLEDNSVSQRLDLLFKKLFLLFTINNRELTLTEDTVSRVIQLFPYLIESYGLIDVQIKTTHKIEYTDTILRHVSRLTTSKRGPTSAELYRIMNRKFTDTTQLKRALEELISLGLLIEKILPPPKGGKVIKCFTLPGVTLETEVQSA